MFASCNSLFSGCMAATMVELFPTRTRYTGIAIGYNVGQALLGGTAPLVATAADQADRQQPGADVVPDRLRDHRGPGRSLIPARHDRPLDEPSDRPVGIGDRRRGHKTHPTAPSEKSETPLTVHCIQHTVWRIIFIRVSRRSSASGYGHQCKQACLGRACHPQSEDACISKGAVTGPVARRRGASLVSHPSSLASPIIQPQTLARQVYEHLLRRIFSGELRPGSTS